ncbi:MAG: nucleoside monophosphate kinase, partial [Muribaculaceae bacterium]|nr:nucleoside monophosphate kinase [Muribaculaceae bacterium]
NAVIGLEANDQELIKRLLKRGIDSGRTDDNLEVINRRLKVYHDQTAPLREYYLERGLYCSINGEGSVDDIFANIVKEIELRMNK